MRTGGREPRFGATKKVTGAAPTGARLRLAGERKATHIRLAGPGEPTTGPYWLLAAAAHRGGSDYGVINS
jgi:hypothetical protein